MIDRKKFFCFLFFVNCSHRWWGLVAGGNVVAIEDSSFWFCEKLVLLLLYLETDLFLIAGWSPAIWKEINDELNSKASANWMPPSADIELSGNYYVRISTLEIQFFQRWIDFDRITEPFQPFRLHFIVWLFDIGIHYHWYRGMWATNSFLNLLQGLSHLRVESSCLQFASIGSYLLD